MKNPHYHKRSRDLHPKPFTNHYTERFPWVEPDDPPTTFKMKLAVYGVPVVILGLILLTAYFGHKYGW